MSILTDPGRRRGRARGVGHLPAAAAPARRGQAAARACTRAGRSRRPGAACCSLTFWTPARRRSCRPCSSTSSALAAIVGGVLTVTSRNPIYSALWFASVVLSTSGLFLLAGAQFLAAGTVIVYAGAIIVTFLFVIMLAQMEGKARLRPGGPVARAAATFTCFLLFWCLLYCDLVIADRSRDRIARDRR